MRHTITDSYELILGALLLGLGLLYLASQEERADRLLHVAMERVIEDQAINQQYNEIDINQVRDTELYAMIMGYREYPIVIDGQVIAPDGNDYPTYFGYIRKGSYTKSYRYDSGHKIMWIEYTYAGA